MKINSKTERVLSEGNTTVTNFKSLMMTVKNDRLMATYYEQSLKIRSSAVQALLKILNSVLVYGTYRITGHGFVKV